MPLTNLSDIFMCLDRHLKQEMEGPRAHAREAQTYLNAAHPKGQVKFYV